jgi:hypothetical protein
MPEVNRSASFAKRISPITFGNENLHELGECQIHWAHGDDLSMAEATVLALNIATFQ